MNLITESLPIYQLYSGDLALWDEERLQAFANFIIVVKYTVPDYLELLK